MATWKSGVCFTTAWTLRGIFRPITNLPVGNRRSDLVCSLIGYTFVSRPTLEMIARATLQERIGPWQATNSVAIGESSAILERIARFRRYGLAIGRVFPHLSIHRTALCSGCE